MSGRSPASSSSIREAACRDPRARLDRGGDLDGRADVLSSLAPAQAGLRLHLHGLGPLGIAPGGLFCRFKILAASSRRRSYPLSP